jgi:carbonic anhydrase/acetyltransferase-like protein (isoleucine patch superfamily)
VVLCGGLVPTELIATSGGTICVGRGSVVNHGVRFQALGSTIVVGQRCLVASGARILAVDARPTEIGDDVWIAHGAVIESGVRIGAGSVIAAGAVVREDVPERSLVLGNPARAVPLALMAEAGVPSTTGVTLPSLTIRSLGFAARTVRRWVRAGTNTNRNRSE